MLRDARLAKQHNFNAIRCSHYPNRDDWYEICNFIGLYLVDEVNCETHGFDATLSKPWLNPTSHPAWAPCILGALLIGIGLRIVCASLGCGIEEHLARFCLDRP